EMAELADRFFNLGFNLYATEGTANFISERGIPVTSVAKIGSDEPNVLSIIRNGDVQFVINTLTSGKKQHSDGFIIRREAVEHGTISLTNLDTAEAILNVIDSTTFSANVLTGKGALKND